MPKLKKIILVTATHHPYHNLWSKLAEEIASKHNVELEVKHEDYVFLIEHGDTDEYGMAWVPQILAEFDDGTIKVLLSQLPLNEALQPDAEKAIEIMTEKIKKYEGKS
ncbi:conserved hypothetical protein [Staphylothermus marinus F1]|uniref:Flavodoxin-like domain-containing protein n=1 Tax=Staphylothermus marinus (strain ATCC 43588 / DSM 3639 / JCM 9404 / F1) TaxID=399550 RepID=A3DMW5_STAMF|nr:hypothetical protein [Staphylothermus marinus]ABN69975.1 conserved hypothetical protein [Staphylothermus marinus F1]